MLDGKQSKSSSEGKGYQPKPFLEIIDKFIKSGQTDLAVLKFLFNLAQSFAFIIAYPWLLLLRHHVGERFLRLPMIFVSFIVLLIACKLVGSRIGATIFVVSLGAAVFHNIHVHLARRSGKRWYSYSLGFPWLGHLHPTLAQPQITAIVHGVLLFMFGMFITEATSQTTQSRWGPQSTSYDEFGMYVILSAVCYFWTQQRAVNRFRDMVLDHFDQQFVNEALQQAVTLNPQKPKPGEFVVPIAALNEAERQALASDETPPADAVTVDAAPQPTPSPLPDPPSTPTPA